MRKVMVSEYKKAVGTPMSILEEIGVAEFHQFGTAICPSGYNIVSYSTAIVEWPDGKVSNVHAELVRFLK